MTSGVPYLGCKISLVSKSEIRYEGILYTIDTKDSTVALAKVRSYGTEGRLTDRPVPPRDEIYEYIIFRASDIKDLHVIEAAKSQQILTAAGLPSDPAIVQVFHSLPVQSALPYSQTPFGQLCGLQTFPHYTGQMAYSNISPLFTNYGSSRSGASSQTSLRKSPTADAGVQVSSSLVDAGRDSKSAEDIGSNTQAKSVSQPNLQSQPQRRTMPPVFRQGRGGFRRGMRGRGRGGFFFNPRTTEPLKFDSEYDFEQANAEFIELESKLAKSKIALVTSDDSGNETAGGGDVEDEICAYDRQKSFFDNISCEASRIAKGIPRFDWRIERKLNAETFGVTVNDNYWFRRRRGRGGFRRSVGNRGASNVLKSADPPKTVTFGGDTLVSLENETPAAAEPSKAEAIPTIEIVVVEKPSDWKEDAASEQWK